VRTCSSIVHDPRLQGVTGEVAALRENVTKFWQDEAQSGPRDEVHRGRHAALLQQLQAVEQRSSSLYYLLDTLASENQAFESHWDSPAPPLPPSPQQSNDVVIGRCVAFRSPSYPSAVPPSPSLLLQISCPVAATGISELCSSLSDRHPRFQAPFFLCPLYNKAPVLFACVLRRGAAGEAAAAQAQVGVRSRALSLACGMRWRVPR
jgi:hypothetical protein